MPYERDILDEFADMRRRPTYPTVDVAPGLVEVLVEVGPDPDAPVVERFRSVHARL